MYNLTLSIEEGEHRRCYFNHQVYIGQQECPILHDKSWLCIEEITITFSMFNCISDNKTDCVRLYDRFNRRLIHHKKDD